MEIQMDESLSKEFLKASIKYVFKSVLRRKPYIICVLYICRD
jgi:hypothetical protein